MKYLQRDLAEFFSSAIPLVIVGCILIIRCLYGLDLTDEMQYYGQIKGMVESGRLFSNDLFIQQIVYILFYPAFKIHAFFWGDLGLVLFGRVLLALLLLAVYLYARGKFVEQGAEKWQAGFVAAALIFCVPYHGIFAISYNTISQLGWIIFMLWFWQWRDISARQWASLIAFSGLAHPVAGICMAVLVFVRLIAGKSWVLLSKYCLWVVAITAIFISYLLFFATPEELWIALKFSRGFAGKTFFSDWRHVLFSLLFCLTIISLPWIPIRLLRWVPTRIFIILMFLFGVVRLLREMWLERNLFAVGYSEQMVMFGAILAATIFWHLIANNDGNDRVKNRWIAVSITTYFFTLIVTSGNGFLQGTGALWLAIPFLLGLWPKSDKTQLDMHHLRLIPNFLCGALALGYFIVHWSTYAYRDQPWYENRSLINGVDAFRYIITSEYNSQKIRNVRSQFLGKTKDKPALVAGLPMLYFALEIKPQTCMFYLHSLPNIETSQIFEECLKKRHPEAILEAFSDKEEIQAMLPMTGKNIQNLAIERGLTQCEMIEIPPIRKKEMKNIPAKYFRYCIRPI